MMLHPIDPKSCSSIELISYYEAIPESTFTLLQTRGNVGGDWNLQNESGLTLLGIAVRDLKAYHVRFFLEQGADPNLTGPQLKPPLFWAITLNRIECVQLLLEYGADPNFLDQQKRSLLSNAVKQGIQKTVDLLIRYGADVQANNDEALIFAVGSGYDRTKILRSLLEAGAHVHARKDATIQHAIRNGDPQSVALLLEFGADFPLILNSPSDLSFGAWADQRQRDEVYGILMAWQERKLLHEPSPNKPHLHPPKRI